MTIINSSLLPGSPAKGFLALSVHPTLQSQMSVLSKASIYRTPFSTNRATGPSQPEGACNPNWMASIDHCFFVLAALSRRQHLPSASLSLLNILCMFNKQIDIYDDWLFGPTPRHFFSETLSSFFVLRPQFTQLNRQYFLGSYIALN